MPEKPARPNFNRCPMLWLGISFAAGILAASLVNIELTVSLAFCAFVAITAIAFRKQYFASYLILIAFVVAGAASIQIEKLSVVPDRLRVLYDAGTIKSGDPVEVEGVLMGSPEPSIDGVFLNLRSEKITYHGSERSVLGNVRLFLPQTYDNANKTNLKSQISDLKYGSRVKIACKLNREDEYLNPGVIPKRELLDRLGVDATGSIKSSMLVEHIADESVFIPLAWVYDQRSQLIYDLRKNLDPSSAGVMIAALLGDKNFLSKDTADLFREGGTFHILVISGLHITFIGGLLLLFLRQVTRNRWKHFIVTTGVLSAYALAVGAHVPVVRATIMFTIVLFSYAIYRRASLLNSLGACAFVLLVWRPSDIFDAAFQLTFVSVAAIIATAYPLVDSLRRIGSWTPSAQTPFPPNVPHGLRRFCEMIYWNRDAWAVESKRQVWTARLFKSPFLSGHIIGGGRTAVRYIFEVTLVSLIIQLWNLPLMVAYFHRVSVASVLMNLWVGSLIAIEGFAAVTGAVVSHVSNLLAMPFFAIAGIVNWLMLSVPRLFVDNGWASFRLPSYSGGGRVLYILYFLPVLILAYAVNRWRPFDLKQQSLFVRGGVMYPAVFALAVLLVLVVFHPFSAPRPDGRLHFDFLDVGQGDSALVTFPDGRTMLVDGGGRVNYKARDEDVEPFEPDTRGIGEAVVSEFLWNRGYSQIDYILATHADADHIQGLGDVAKNFTIGSAAFGRTPLANAEFAEVYSVLQARHIPAVTITRGDRLDFGEVIVEVLYPVATDDPNAVSDNNHCVVLRILTGSRAFLLTGDIEKEAETYLINGGDILNVDLIKVPHHGSRTSSTQPFIDATQAKYAVISVGRYSSFGHPHPEVVERWKNFGARVMTTGERGTISVSTDGRDLAITRFISDQ